MTDIHAAGDWGLGIFVLCILRAGGRRRRGASPGWRMGEPFLRGGAPDNTEEGAADQNYPG